MAPTSHGELIMQSPYDGESLVLERFNTEESIVDPVEVDDIKIIGTNSKVFEF